MFALACRAKQPLPLHFLRFCVHALQRLPSEATGAPAPAPAKQGQRQGQEAGWGMHMRPCPKGNGKRKKCKGRGRAAVASRGKGSSVKTEFKTNLKKWKISFFVYFNFHIWKLFNEKLIICHVHLHKHKCTYKQKKMSLFFKIFQRIVKALKKNMIQFFNFLLFFFREKSLKIWKN